MRRVAWSTRAVLVAVLAVGCAVASSLFGGGVVGGGAVAGAAPAPAPAPVPAPAPAPPPAPQPWRRRVDDLPAGLHAGAGRSVQRTGEHVHPSDVHDRPRRARRDRGRLGQHAYIRTWSRPYVGSDDDGIIADLVVEFPNSADTAAFLDGLQGALSTQSAVTTFSVASPSGAEGYSAHGVIVPNSTDVAVSLGRGDFATFVMAATPAGNVSRSQVELVAAARSGGSFPVVLARRRRCGSPSRRSSRRCCRRRTSRARAPGASRRCWSWSSRWWGWSCWCCGRRILLGGGSGVGVGVRARRRWVWTPVTRRAPTIRALWRLRLLTWAWGPDTPLPYRAPSCRATRGHPGSLTPAGPTGSVRSTPCRHVVAPRPLPRTSASDAASRTSPTPSTRASRRRS